MREEQPDDLGLHEHSGITELIAAAPCDRAFVFTYAMLRVIDWVTPVRVVAVDENGLDKAELGESA